MEVKKIISNLNKNFFIFFFVVLCFIYATGQLSNPYIRHDDWEFMIYLLPDMPNHGTPWDKTLWEGRWVNYLWSFFARDLSVNTNYIIFLLGYSLFCWAMASLFFKDFFKTFIVAISMFLCVAYADLSLWPATLSSSVWISFLLLILYKTFQNRFILLILFPILVMSYAPLVAVCFLAIMLYNNNSKRNEIISIGVIYYVGYVSGVILIYLLNYYYHDFFGVKIADWRNPNPIHSLEDLRENIVKTLYFWKGVIYENKCYLSISVAILFLAFIKNQIYKYLSTILAIVFIVTIESSLSIYSGVDIPVRSIIWPWFFFISISILAIKESYILVKILGFILILLLCISGIERWYGFYTYESKHSLFENILGNTLKNQGQRDVFVCGDVKDITGYGGRDLKPLTLAIWKKNGINLLNADKEDCNNLPSISGLHKLNGKSFYVFLK